MLVLVIALCVFLCLLASSLVSLFVFFLVPYSTSPPGVNQVDGLPPAPILFFGAETVNRSAIPILGTEIFSTPVTESVNRLVYSLLGHGNRE